MEHKEQTDAEWETRLRATIEELESKNKDLEGRIDEQAALRREAGAKLEAERAFVRALLKRAGDLQTRCEELEKQVENLRDDDW